MLVECAADLQVLALLNGMGRGGHGLRLNPWASLP